MNYKRKSRRRFFLLVRSRTPPISSEFRGGGLNTPPLGTPLHHLMHHLRVCQCLRHVSWNAVGMVPEFTDVFQHCSFVNVFPVLEFTESLWRLADVISANTQSCLCASKWRSTKLRNSQPGFHRTFSYGKITGMSLANTHCSQKETYCFAMIFRPFLDK